MSSVIIAGDTSGSITLAAPAVSGSSVLTLPAATGTFITTTGGVTPGTTGNLLTSNGTNWTSAAASSIVGGYVQIGATQNASTSSSINFTSTNYASAFNGTYDVIRVIVQEMVPDTDGAFWQMRVSQSASFKSDASGYIYASNYGANAAATYMRFNTTYSASSTVENGLSGDIHIYALNNTAAYKKFVWNLSAHGSTSVFLRISGAGTYRTNTSAIDGFQFFYDTGNILSGKFTLYGITK